MKYVTLSALFLASLCGCKQEHKPVALEAKAATRALFLLQGKPIEVKTAPRSEAIGLAVPIQRFTEYASLECDVAWNQRCEGDFPIEAWSGWQVCRVYYSENYKGGHDAWVSVTPTAWYTGDAQSPDRYRAVSIRIHAFGSGNPFNQLGSRIFLTDIGITMIPAEADNFQRYQAGCEMPAHD